MLLGKGRMGIKKGQKKDDPIAVSIGISIG